MTHSPTPVFPDDRFGLPADYRAGTVTTTLDHISGRTYWNPRRIRLSGLYQYSVYRLALAWAQRMDAKVFMDVGCGTGMKLPMLARARPGMAIIGIDQASATAFCRTQHPFARFESDNFDEPRTDLSLPRADVIVCADVIEHVANPDRLLAYLRARLNDGGVIVLSTPDRARLQDASVRAPLNPDHIREWTFDEFAAYLRSRGFEVVDHVHQPGMRPDWCFLYARMLLRHVFTGRPRSLVSNQVAILRPAASADSNGA